MSYTPLNDIDVGFKKSLLAGGTRLQTVAPKQLFEGRHQYNVGPVLWEDDPENTDTGNTVSHLPNESGVSLAITGNSGDKATRQTYQYFTYTPSKPLKFEFAVLFPTEDADLRARAGAFDTENGFFLEKEGTTLNIVRRTKTSGSVVDNEVAQASWNVDTLDGTGASGKTLDLTKIQMVFVEYLWYGAGTARIGFEIDGEAIIAHEFYIANNIATPSATTGNLPIRYEIENTGTTSVTSTMKVYGTSVVSEGGESSTRGYLFSQKSGAVTAALDTPTHAISIRPKTTFNSITNRIKFELESVEIINIGSNPVFWKIGYGHTLTSASWTDANATYSGFEYDVSGSINTQPTIEGPAGFVGGSNQSATPTSVKTKNIIPVSLDAAGAVRDLGTLGVFVESVDTGTSEVEVCLNWKEII